MTAGFDRRRRISESAVFQAALSTRPRSKGSLFDVHCVDPVLDERTPDAAPPCRLGLVVPKRICRSAARRNWIKRLVRESFRTEMSRASAVDCVVRLRRVPGDAPAARAELLVHWRRIGV